MSIFVPLSQGLCKLGEKDPDQIQKPVPISVRFDPITNCRKSNLVEVKEVGKITTELDVCEMNYFAINLCIWLFLIKLIVKLNEKQDAQYTLSLNMQTFNYS